MRDCFIFLDGKVLDSAPFMDVEKLDEIWKARGSLTDTTFLKNYVLSLSILLLLCCCWKHQLPPKKKKKKNDSGWPSLSSIGEHLEAKFDAFFTQVVPGNFFTSKNSPRSPISTNDVVTADGIEKHELHTILVHRNCNLVYYVCSILCVRDLIFDDDLVDRLEPAWK